MNSNNKSPILILECANAHGGDQSLLKTTFSRFGLISYPNKHVKLQPFHYDTIALPDFPYYAVYKELYFSRLQWVDLIKDAKKNFDGVWLDIFDCYGVQVLEENLEYIFGIKLQASVLDNFEIYAALRDVNLSNKVLMINVSGYDLSSIQEFIALFSHCKVGEIILQVGHQAYPTELKDTSLQKISVLKACFPEIKICIADHISAVDDMACILPVLGVSEGANLIEKHICLDRAKAKYDHSAALEFNEIQVLANRLMGYLLAKGDAFISRSEKDYLEKSIQIPVAGKKLNAGSLVAQSDLVYRRTGQMGGNFREILDAQNRYSVLADDIQLNSTIKTSQLKLARIATIVACRMKSSRLKNKAIINVSGRPFIEHCLVSCLGIESADLTVLATSNLPEDDVLETYTLDGRVKLWRGEPDDVIQRYLGACNEYGIDVVIRVTADCPMVSPEIANILLKHHFQSGADYTAAKNSAIGTACEIYNTESLRRVIGYLGKAEHSEYMTWYMQNNQDIFKVELVDLPPEMVREYRLTIDYPEDQAFFESLYKELDQRNLPIKLKNIFDILDECPEIANLNSHLSLVYKTDKTLIDRLNQATKIKTLQKSL